MLGVLEDRLPASVQSENSCAERCVNVDGKPLISSNIPKILGIAILKAYLKPFTD